MIIHDVMEYIVIQVGIGIRKEKQDVALLETSYVGVLIMNVSLGLA